MIAITQTKEESMELAICNCVNCIDCKKWINEYPCDMCIEANKEGRGAYSMWRANPEPEEEDVACVTCLFDDLGLDDEPCRTCAPDEEADPGYIPRGTVDISSACYVCSGQPLNGINLTLGDINSSAPEPNCSECVYEPLTGSDEPCASCLPGLRNKFLPQYDDYDAPEVDCGGSTDNQQNLMYLLEDYIEQALVTMGRMPILTDPRVARALSLTKTKLQEALFWLREGK